MLINLRNALMAGKRLPYDAEVEYLESTGTQWIDTGIDIANYDDARFVTTCTITNIVTISSSTWVGSGMLSVGGLHYVLDNYGIRTGGGTTSNAIPYNRGDIVTIDVYYDSQHRRTCKIGQSIYQGTAYNAQTARLAILNYPAPTTPYPYQSGKLFHVEVYMSGTLVRDFIPVRKGMVGYLYDRVSGKLFGNAGTGDFVLGPDVVPVEYIESHVTEWIDTGVVPTADDSFYCRVQQSSIRDQCLWGLAGVAYCFSNTDYAGQTTGGTYWGHPAIGAGGVSGVNPLGDTNWHEILCQPSGVLVDGVQINTQVTAPTQSPLNTVALFARSVNSAGGGVAKNGQGRISAFKVEHNGDPLRSFRPVRVGTDETSWEGAMMDVLTRRIYRNAGTGAFTYGNDLKYPIPAE